MVFATLTALLDLEYDDYEILMVDDITDDPSAVAAGRGVLQQARPDPVLHLEDWPGYKSGALNFALAETDPRAEVVGVVDADYLVRAGLPGALRPALRGPRVVVRTDPAGLPRLAAVARYFRRLYHAYGYFFDVSQRSRARSTGRSSAAPWV